MKISALLFVFVLTMSFCMTAQNVVFGQKFNQYVFPVQGNYNESPGMTLSWTIGETFIETVYLEDQIFTQGFQQSFLEIREVPNPALASFDVQIFPNPTAGILNINIQNFGGFYHIEMLDITGKLLYKSKRSDANVELDLAAYASGQYFIRLTDPVHPKYSLFEIIKL